MLRQLFVLMLVLAVLAQGSLRGLAHAHGGHHASAQQPHVHMGSDGHEHHHGPSVRGHAGCHHDAEHHSHEHISHDLTTTHAETPTTEGFQWGDSHRHDDAVVVSICGEFGVVRNAPISDLNDVGLSAMMYCVGDLLARLPLSRSYGHIVTVEQASLPIFLRTLSLRI